MFDAEKLLGKVVGELIGSGHSSKHKSGSSFLGNLASGGGLLTAIGLGIGAYEILQEKKQSQPPPIQPGVASPPPPPFPSAANASSAPPDAKPNPFATPPPSPATPATAPVVEADTASATSAATEPLQLSPQELSLKMIRVMIAATHADGVLDTQEEEAILAKLKDSGLTAEEKMFMINELHSPQTVDQLAAGVTEPKLANALYSLAANSIAIDTPAERAWLDELAARLNISKAMQSFLEEQ